MPRIIIEGYRCQRCNHHWAPRNGTGYRDKEDPKTCPKCKTPYWNKPRINRARIPIMVESGATPHVNLEGYQCDRCGPPMVRLQTEQASGQRTTKTPNNAPSAEVLTGTNPDSGEYLPAGPPHKKA